MARAIKTFERLVPKLSRQTLPYWRLLQSNYRSLLTLPRISTLTKAHPTECTEDLVRFSNESWTSDIFQLPSIIPSVPFRTRGGEEGGQAHVEKQGHEYQTFERFDCPSYEE